MFKVIYWLVFHTVLLFSQNNIYHSQLNIKIFGDYLFCQKDYLRAIEEYNRLDSVLFSDTMICKLGYSYLQIGDYESSSKYFDDIESLSPLKSYSVNYKSLNYYLKNDLILLRENIELNQSLNITDSKKLLLVSEIMNNKKLPSNKELLIFNHSEKIFINDLIQKKRNPDYKSPTVAGILSIIPGFGKFYTKNYSDGLTSLLITGLFSFLAYDNFKNSHQFRGYLFSVTALGFYLGNIYGSVASAYRYNRNYDEIIMIEVDDYLTQKNYFIQKVNFCE